MYTHAHAYIYGRACIPKFPALTPGFLHGNMHVSSSASRCTCQCVSVAVRARVSECKIEQTHMRACLCCCISACMCVRHSIRMRTCLRVLLTGTRHAHDHMPAAPSPQATRWLGSMCLTTDEPALLCVCMRLYWGLHAWMRTLWYMHICRPHRQRRQLVARAVLRRAHPTAMAAGMPVQPIFTHPSFFAGIPRDRGDAERGHCRAEQGVQRTAPAICRLP